MTEAGLGPRRGLLLACGLVLTGVVSTWAVQGDQTGRIGGFLGSFSLGFVAQVVALHASVGLSARALRAALGLAVLWRLLLALGPPLASDDVNRYVWEGRVQLHGGNPYAWSDRPNAPRWDGLRDAVYEGMNHKDYTAAYPPLWQMAAAAVVWARDGVTPMKLFLVACEILALFVLSRALTRRGQPAERLLVWAWSPLALVEIAGSGHNEAFGLLFVALALLALDSGRPLLAALASALGFQAKLLPGLIAAAWWRRFRPWHVGAAAILAAVLVWPYWDARPTLLLSLGKYAEHWRFNESLFAPLAWAFGHGQAVRVGAAITLLLAFGLGLRRVETARAGLLLVASALLLGPNLLPWYALWLLPFLVLVDAPAALVFTGTVTFAYLVYPGWQSGERWYLPWSARALVYLPGLAILFLGVWRTVPGAPEEGPEKGPERH